MRRISALLAACLILFSCVSPALADNGDTIVYVTKTGECYHTAGCSYLKSSIAISLAEAAENYRPCSRCNPPVLDTPQPRLPTRPSTGSTTAPQTTPTTRTEPYTPPDEEEVSPQKSSNGRTIAYATFGAVAAGYLLGRKSKK